MSMLAEPRRKQKVINLRAKNNAWSNDSTKFGQKMLEKMGWSSGKGLGAKEDGIVEHVVARYKNDEKGLGYEDKNDQWTKHEDDFNALLANLSNDDKVNETLHSGISLEKKSKKSKARIHYHKFTRGKDLSRYSEKDLANIFGKKSFKEIKVEEPAEENVKTTEQIFTEKGNMDVYFKTKVAALKSKALNPIDTDNYDASDCVFKGFSMSNELDSQNGTSASMSEKLSFYNSQKDNIINHHVELMSSIEIEKTDSKKKKKSKKKAITSDTEEVLSECVQETIQEVVIDVTQIKTKKSKKKRCQKGEIPVFDEKETKNRNHIEENLLFLEDDVVPIKKKKKIIDEINSQKKRKNENVEQLELFTEDDVPKKKKKNKQQHL